MRVVATVVFVVSLVMNATVVADEQKVRITELRGSLHLLQGRGGNVVASVGADGILLVDDDYEPLAGDYQQALNKLSGATDTPSYVLNTHWHGDHTGANTHWAQSGAVIVAQTNVRQRMSRPSKNPVTGKDRPARPMSALPVISYANSMSLFFNADDVELQHFPSGHTDGDSVVFFSAQNVVHMGDLFFNGAFPFVDTSSGGSLDGYILNVERVLQRVDGDTLIVPGHGPLASKKDLERYLAMIRATQNEVLKAIASGKNAQGILEQGLSPQWESWGRGFIKEHQWIATLLAANS